MKEIIFRIPSGLWRQFCEVCEQREGTDGGHYVLRRFCQRYGYEGTKDAKQSGTETLTEQPQPNTETGTETEAGVIQ